MRMLHRFVAHTSGNVKKVNGTNLQLHMFTCISFGHKISNICIAMFRGRIILCSRSSALSMSCFHVSGQLGRLVPTAAVTSSFKTLCVW